MPDQMTIAEALALDELDQRRRVSLRKRLLERLEVAFSNWEGWDRLGTLGDDLWDAAKQGLVDPESLFEEPQEGVEVMPGADWG